MISDIKIYADRAKKTLNELLKRVEDKRPIWKQFVNFYTQDMIPKSFASRGMLMNGERWHTFTPRYLKWRQKHYPGKQMLKLTTALYDKATNPNIKSSKDSLTMTISGLPYIAVHQYGGGNNIPARPYFFTKRGDIPNKAYAYLIQVTNTYLEEADK